MHPKKNSLLLPFAALLIALVFTADVLTPLGYAEWTLYVVPVALCLFIGRPGAPLLAGLACSLLMIVGYVFSPEGLDVKMAWINRIMGSVAIWVVAIVASRFISTRREIERLTWLERGRALMSSRIAGVQTPEEIARSVLATLVEYTGCAAGVFYRREGDHMVRIGASALTGDPPKELAFGSTLAGQAALDGTTRVIGPLADGYLEIGSALGRMKPGAIVITPTLLDGAVNGVIELAFVQSPRELDRVTELLGTCSAKIGVALSASLSRIRLEELLEETQRQHEELQTQQEELRVSNEELEEQGNVLKESKEQLERQQAELEQSNVQLEEYSNHLERQKQELLITQRTLKENAEALERTNQYKSEFLANMSHELRTPLNSSLILSKLLADNADGSLSEVQVRYAKTIQASNHDLLNLINDILDLAKIESGKVETDMAPVLLSHLLDPLKLTFEPIALDAKVAFRIEVAKDVPETIITDLLRVQQIIKNLLSNAFKFTEAGEVVLAVLVTAGGEVRFEVRDTGIGIPEAQQQVIFEAFRQADGSTSRQFGGTGLGLSISRELARLLQGTITVSSFPGEGSTFTLSLPLVPDLALHAAQQDGRQGPPPPGLAYQSRIGGTYPGALPGFSELKAAMDALSSDTREEGRKPGGSLPEPSGEAALATGAELHAGSADAAAAAAGPADAHPAARGRTILVIEDDTGFSAIIKDLARGLDFECVTTDNALEGLALARELLPKGILLDIGLPDRSGLAVLEQLKRDPLTRPIPVHMVSASDHTQMALELGAVGYLMKPAMPEQLTAALKRVESQSRREVKSVLIVEDDPTLRDNLMLLLQADAVDLVGVGTITDALRMLDERSFDCMVMDLGLPDGSGYELLEQLSQGGRYAFPPVIVYTGRSISREEEQRLRRYSRSIIIKGARSPERLVDEVTLFLHQVESKLPADQQRLLKVARSRDSALEGKKILLVEDDVRNVFALINVLEPLGATVEIARNGREAVDKLRGAVDIDLVLMDIMMPEMDGFAAMKEIRSDERLAKLPIIALTANAMPEDRTRCLEAGADDYISKPIDIDRLVSLCRVWMPK
jgi:signal transduction histidine kinase/DNA-binding response OmpR family regulator